MNGLEVLKSNRRINVQFWMKIYPLKILIQQPLTNSPG